MPTALKNLIDLGYVDGGAALSYLINAKNHLYYAGDYIESQDWANANIQLHDAGDDLGYVGRYLLQDDVFYESLRRDWRDALYYINDYAYFDGAAEVTMDAILSAMVDADPSQVTYFIGLVDAYRSALWEKPFNSEFFAALARGFMQKWP